MTPDRYSVMLGAGCYTVERTVWTKVDNGKLTAIREIAGVFGSTEDDFAFVAAVHFRDDLNKLLPVIEQSAFPVFKRPTLLEQLAAL